MAAVHAPISIKDLCSGLMAGVDEPWLDRLPTVLLPCSCCHLLEKMETEFKTQAVFYLSRLVWFWKGNDDIILITCKRVTQSIAVRM